MYQIEFRPGWRWMRDFKKFNASMRDEEGRFRFNGPYCRIEDWIELSREIGADITSSRSNGTTGYAGLKPP
jgi:hypothetical protein